MFINDVYEDTRENEIPEMYFFIFKYLKMKPFFL